MEKYKIQATDDMVLDMLRDYRFVHERKVETINGRQMTYDTFDIGQYRTILTSSKDIEFATCNCRGFHILTKCKHIHYALLKKGESTPHGLANTNRKQTNEEI
jgi:hypothetical protein